ncbi:glycerate kinase [Halalkalibacter hemicellulosilyticus]|uniref:Glycerate kinase n=1 Tax=Halalkalibacter hemicellulosilyticusJCM 9152 TaxID=1236971 RepID=W4QDK3_9BACI|nr:glycerate kinase [Halalkalibacter hemicellulosilyticus]GAE29419.1 glycerate kinase [Halalkalibacter hemicellulosilyticusJCM 9152]
MNILIAPDSFKGSLDANQVCQTIKEAIHSIDSSINIKMVPLADGGEGTTENMVRATDGKRIKIKVHDPLNREIEAFYGVLGDGETVVIDVAQASGLLRLDEKERNPLITTSYGTGELIKAALDHGYRRFIIGLGGSATNDAGAGILQALGARLLQNNGEELPLGGGALSALSYIDLSHFDKRINESSFLVASDVTNVLCGKNGASVVFGPQKGATDEMVPLLDQNLAHFASVVKTLNGSSLFSIKGGGAAGGIGATLVHFFQAKMRSGIDLMMEEVHFRSLLQNVDLVVTGEGKLDSQTLSGKVIKGVGEETKRLAIPTIAFCGQLDLSPKTLEKIGITAAFSIVQTTCSIDEALENSEKWLRMTVMNVFSVLLPKS